MTSTNNSTILRELKLHSPVGFEPAVFTWPSIERQVNTLFPRQGNQDRSSSSRQRKKMPCLSVATRSSRRYVSSSKVTDMTSLTMTDLFELFVDYPELYQQNLGLATCDIHSYSHMKELCDKFNKIIDTHIKLNRGTEAFSARLQQRATAKLFRHVLAQVYSRAVIDPEKLRDYAPFSPSVIERHDDFFVHFDDESVLFVGLRRNFTGSD